MPAPTSTDAFDTLYLFRQQLFRRREQKREHETKEAHLFERYREKGVAGERKVSAMNCQDWFTCVAYDFIVVVCLVLEFHLH